MTIHETLCIAVILAIIVIMVCKISDTYNKKIKATDKALLELYDRITNLEQQVDELKDNSITTTKN